MNLPLESMLQYNIGEYITEKHIMKFLEENDINELMRHHLPDNLTNSLLRFYWYQLHDDIRKNFNQPSNVIPEKSCIIDNEIYLIEDSKLELPGMSLTLTNGSIYCGPHDIKHSVFSVEIEELTVFADVEQLDVFETVMIPNYTVLHPNI